MNRLKFATSALIALAAPLLCPSAMAQDGGERVNQLIVFGEDPCPAPSSPDEITVCARKDEGERYRIPEALRGSTAPDNDAWNNRVKAYETVTRTGTLSCSPVGGGGYLGCTQKLVNAAYAEKASDPSVKFSQLIADERARRLATIDVDAAETQARVEALERQYDARQRAAQEGGEEVEPKAE